MSKPPKADKRVYLRCPWCSRQPVQVKRGRLTDHVTPGNQRCVGAGQHVAEYLFQPPRKA